MGGAVTPRESAGAPVAGDTAAFSRRPAPRDGASAGASEDLWPHPAPRPQEKGAPWPPLGGRRTFRGRTLELGTGSLRRAGRRAEPREGTSPFPDAGPSGRGAALWPWGGPDPAPARPDVPTNSTCPVGKLLKYREAGKLSETKCS